MLFSRRLFSQWMQLWHFKLVWMKVHGRFEENLRLQVPGKVVAECGLRLFSMVFELFLCELDGYIYIKSMLVIYFNCMSHYMDFNACFFRGDFSANECSCDISNWFEWKCTGDSREIYVCRCLGKLLQNADWGYKLWRRIFKNNKSADTWRKIVFDNFL